MEGLPRLNEQAVNRNKLDPEQFLGLMTRVVSYGPRHGLCQIITSKNGKPLCYSIGFVTSNPLEEQALHVFFVYSNGKSKTAVPKMLEDAKAFCRENGIDNITASSARTSGASIRWFETKMGFRRDGLNYKLIL